MTRRAWITAILISGLLGSVAATASAASPSPRAATGSARSGLVSTFTANDGSVSEIHSVYVSGTLGMVCIHTPDAGTQAYVFRHVGRTWQYAASGTPGRAGNTADRQLERVCH